MRRVFHVLHTRTKNCLKKIFFQIQRNTRNKHYLWLNNRHLSVWAFIARIWLFRKKKRKTNNTTRTRTKRKKITRSIDPPTPPSNFLNVLEKLMKHVKKHKLKFYTNLMPYFQLKRRIHNQIVTKLWKWMISCRERQINVQSFYVHSQRLS